MDEDLAARLLEFVEDVAKGKVRHPVVAARVVLGWPTVRDAQPDENG